MDIGRRPGRPSAGRREKRDVRVADDGDARLRFQIHPVDVLAEMELAGHRGRRTGIRRKIGMELRRVPRCPRGAELIDAGRVSAAAVVGIAERRRRSGAESRSRGDRTRSLGKSSQALRAVGARAHDVGLIVEDEQVAGRCVLRERRLLEHLDLVDLEERVAVHLVHREEGGSQAARAFEELPPRHPELFRGLAGELLHPRFDLLLLLRLRERHVLAVGDHASRNGGLKGLALRRSAAFELRVAQPGVFFA